MRLLAAFVFLCLCVVHCSAVQIVEFCPDPYLYNDEDEYLVLAGSGSLDGITVSDGNGGFRFPPGTTLHGTVTVARNAIAFEESHGRLPDFEWLDHSRDVPNVINGATLRMANAKDNLMLYDNGRLIQKVAWPDDVKPREGQVHFLLDGTWDRRVLLIGQTRLLPATFQNVTVTTFVSPDCSYEMFSFAVDRAQQELLVNVYEFTSTNLSTLLVDAHKRGVDVDVLVEGGPVGGVSPEEKTMVWMMNQSGIPIYQMTAPAGGHAPYRYDHAKYLVIDRQSVLLTSENFKYSGFPPPGVSGNRGWGVWLESPGIASSFSGIKGPAEIIPDVTYTAEFSPERFEDATVSIVIAPDTSDQITRLLDSAQTTIEIEQAYITNESATKLNPYLVAAINASRRGVAVRVLLDSYWYNVEDTKDNDEMAALINQIAATEHLPLEARCADLQSGGIEKIHNKGVIVDERRVLVSSINWNSNSPNFNREAGVIIDQVKVARYFRAVFEDDWAPAVRSKPQNVDYLKIAAVIVVIALLIGLYHRRHIR
ncbi:MAG: phospholipase D-like domain-containing protein [Methanoregula sp.]|nr:phospholipase D-like domain-containing protein [Methanoregula sp.]